MKTRRYFGSKDKKSTGVFSDISITSFYGSHVISCAGNGGMFLTNDKNNYLKAKVLRSWGRQSSLIKNSEDIINRLILNSKDMIMIKSLFSLKQGIILSHLK